MRQLSVCPYAVNDPAIARTKITIAEIKFDFMGSSIQSVS